MTGDETIDQTIDGPIHGPVERVSESRLPTPWGEFRVVAFRSSDGHEHLALVVGDVAGEEPVLVRVHSECLTGDTFGSLRCDCQAQLHDALARVQAAGRGVVVYVRGHEGRGIGLAAKIGAYELQDRGLDTYDANLALGFPVDARRFDVAAAILTDLGVRSVRLITNNPSKQTELEAGGIPVAERLPSVTQPTSHNARYLRTKQDRMGHQLDRVASSTPP